MENQITNLKAALQMAIKRNQFELAAKLREDIRTLEVREVALGV